MVSDHLSAGPTTAATGPITTVHRSAVVTCALPMMIIAIATMYGMNCDDFWDHMWNLWKLQEEGMWRLNEKHKGQYHAAVKRRRENGYDCLW